MKKKYFIFICITVFIPIILFSQKKIVDKIVAVVDNEIILESELNLQLIQYAASEKIDPQAPELKKKVLEQIINNQLLLAQARLDSIVVTDDEISQAIDQQIKYLLQQYGSEERLAQIANMSINRMKIEFKDDMKKRILIQRTQENFKNNIRVSRREVEEFFYHYKDSLPPVPEEVELYHIFIYPKPSDEIKNQTRSLAQKILDSLKSGVDFSLMAQHHSEHPSGKNGGDLPLVKRGTFIKEFEEAAFSLQPGQVSGIVESPLGFFIIKLLDRKGESVLVKQILLKIKKSQSDDESAINLLKEIKNRIKKGERFVDLAKKYSEDVSTKDFGGLLGRFSSEEIPENLIKVIKGMNIGEISNPEKYSVSNNYGYQIILLDKKIAAHKMTLEGDLLRIELIAKNYKQNQEFKKWVDDIKKQIHLDIKI